MKLSISKLSIEEIKSDALIVLANKTCVLSSIPKGKFKLHIERVINEQCFSGEIGEYRLFESKYINSRYILLIGCGNESINIRNIERSISSAIRVGKKHGCNYFSIMNDINSKDITSSSYQFITGRGAIWGSYKFRFDKKDESNLNKPLRLAFIGSKTDKNSIIAAQSQGQILLKNADIANFPANIVTPKYLSDFSKKLRLSSNLQIETLEKKDIERLGFGGLLAVSQGSKNQPSVIILKHNPYKRKNKPIVIIGKTVTFDSGGISLKPSKNMEWMRYDKCGGISVLTIMQIIDSMKLDIPVIGILGAAENMPGNSAIRPGDIIKMYNGKSVEIKNTDAEGRLILADMLSYSKKFQPEIIIDIATLTGAVITALGKEASAVIGSCQKLINDILICSVDSGERIWQLPLYKEYLEDMKSSFADLSNLSKSGTAGTATAAAFLSEFVPLNTSWVHLDIAGTAWEENDKPYQSPGATLSSVRLLTQWLCNKAK